MPEVKTERVLKILIVLCLGLLVYVIATSLRERVIGVDDTAPDFKVTAEDGRVLSRSDFGGRLLVLNFWASWCQPCIQEMPSLNEFHKRFAGAGVVVLGVSVDRNENVYRKALKSTGVSFPIARDPEARISASYGTYMYPETYIIDRRGKVLEKVIGPANWTEDAIVNRVKMLLGRS